MYVLQAKYGMSYQGATRSWGTWLSGGSGLHRILGSWTPTDMVIGGGKRTDIIPVTLKPLRPLSLLQPYFRPLALLLPHAEAKAAATAQGMQWQWWL